MHSSQFEMIVSFCFSRCWLTILQKKHVKLIHTISGNAGQCCVHIQGFTNFSKPFSSYMVFYSWVLQKYILQSRILCSMPLRPKLNSVKVVLTINASLKCEVPAARILFTMKRKKRETQINKTKQKDYPSITVKIQGYQWSVHLQYFTQNGSSFFPDFILWVSTIHSLFQIHHYRCSKCLLPDKDNWVNVVFFINASLKCLIPSASILLSDIYYNTNI